MDAAITKTRKEGETLLATAVSTREQELHQDHSFKMQEVQDGHNNIVVSMKEEHLITRASGHCNRLRVQP